MTCQASLRLFSEWRCALPYSPMAFFRRKTKAPPRPKTGPAPAPPKATRDYEHIEQAKFFALLSQINHPASKLTFAIPNQAVAKMRSKAMRLRFWREGVRAGVSDVLCLARGDTHAFLAMEFKAPSGRVSPEQTAFLEACRAAGGVAVVVFSAQEAFAAWLDYLGMDAKYF